MKSTHFNRNQHNLEFRVGTKDFWTQIHHHTDQQNAAWFKSDFCVNCASHIATLLMIDLFVCEISEKFTVVQLIFIGKIQTFQQESAQLGISCEGKGFLNTDLASGSSWSNKLSIDNGPFCQRYTKC